MDLTPNHCSSMTDVRAGVDRIDAELCKLIGLRFGYMRAAARIKLTRDLVRDEARKAEVIRNIRREAADANWSPEAAGQIWEILIEASIAYELQQFESLREQQSE